MRAAQVIVASVTGLSLVTAGCGSSAPLYRLTGGVRASCFAGEVPQPQGSCSMHAQIQNEGGLGRGGRAELILYFRPPGSSGVISASCSSDFPSLDTKDVAEMDCQISGQPPIFASRIVRTALKITPRS